MDRYEAATKRLVLIFIAIDLVGVAVISFAHWLLLSDGFQQ